MMLHTMTVRKAASALVVGALFLGLLLYIYFPAVPRSTLGWVALVGLGLPVWLFLEWLGEVVLDSALFRRRSSGFRILVGVPVVLMLMAIAVACVRLVQAAIFAV
jgi:hypothetical protein